MFMGLTEPAFIIAFLLIIAMPQLLNFLMAMTTIMFVLTRRYVVPYFLRHTPVSNTTETSSYLATNIRLHFKSLLSKLGMTLTLLSYADIPAPQLDLVIRVGAVLGVVLSAMSSAPNGIRTVIDTTFGGILGALIGNIWFLNKEIKQQGRYQLAEFPGMTVVHDTDSVAHTGCCTAATKICFDTGETAIPQQGQLVLDKLADEIADMSKTQSCTITIIGHTDDSGNDAINNSLSIDRASQTRNYLISKGVASAHIKIEGRSSHEPIAANDTSAGRAFNRRVEIHIGTH